MRRLLALLLLCLTPLAAAAQDAGDRGYLQGLLEDALSAPGRTVRIEGFAGALSSRATIDRLTVTDPGGTWLVATDLALSWNRAALISGRIEIAEITIGTLDLPRRPLPPETTLPAPEARGAFSLPDLPVSVQIAQMRIGRASLGAALFGEAAQVSLSGRADLEGGAGAAMLDIRRLDRPGSFVLDGGFDNASRVLAIDLSLREPAGGIAATLLNLQGTPAVALSLKGDDPIADFTAAIRLATAGQDRLTGQVTLSTSAAGDTRFSADLGGDVAPVFAPDFAEFLGRELRLQTDGARDPDGALRLDALRLSSAALSIEGAGALAPDGWPLRLALDVAITPPAGDSVILPLPGPRSAIASATFTARFDAASGDAWRIDGRAEGLEQDGLRIATTEFTGAGTIQRAAQSVAGQLGLDIDGLVPGDPALARALGPRLTGGLRFGWSAGAPLRLHDIALSGADYGLIGTLSVAGLDQIEDLTLVPDIALNARDLSRFSGLVGRDIAGGAELAITGRAEPLTGRFGLGFSGTTSDIALGIARLDPLLAGPGTLTLRLERDETGLTADPLSVATAHAAITGAIGLRSGSSAVQLSARLPEIALALPELSGAGELTLNAQQLGSAWSVEADATLPGATALRYRGTVSGDGTAEWRADGELGADAGDLSAFSGLAGRRLGGAASLTADITADLLARSASVDATGTTSGLDAGLPALAPLTRGEIAYTISGAGGLDDPVTIRAFTAQGSGIDAALSGAIGAQDGQLDFRLALADLGLIVPDLPGAAQASGTATLQGDRWRIDTGGTGPGGITLATAGTVAASGTSADLAITGQVPLALANARLRGQALSGLARLDLALNGPLALSALSGRVSLADARLALPAQNLALDRLRGDIGLAGGSAQLALEADISSGGRLRLSGPVALSPPYPAALVVELLGVTLRDATLYEADFDGRLGVEGPLAGGARITGAIDLRSAELRLPQFSPSYSALDGLRHLGPAPAVQRTLRYAGLDGAATANASLPEFPLDLTLNAPARVAVRGRGLDAELGGSVRLTGTTNDILPVGGFTLIRGRLDLLGRRLVLTEGSAQLRGSFDPVINFAAASTVEDVTVFLRLEGLASAPELTITSVPDLPQEEALSLFLFGRDATRISPFQAIQLAAAIRTLSGRGGPGLTEGLRRGLGVDDLDIGVDATGAAQARVGKYISENIYTDVTVKSDGTSQINLNLEINPNVKLRGRLGSDGDSGLGIYYERDY